MKEWIRKVAVYLMILLVFTIAIEYKSSRKDMKEKLPENFNNVYKTKKLIIGRANDSLGLDPANVTDIDSLRVTSNIFETLVKYEKEGKEIIPGLAASYKYSEDGLVFTFRLRQGIKFHDGTDFNADAVVFNFKRWMDKDNIYHNGEFEYYNYVFNGFPGIIKDVTAVNNYTVEIKLNKPYAPFLSSLAMPVFGIASPNSIKEYKNDVYKHPVGTGPFMFKSWKTNESITLVKNNEYWGGKAKVDEIEFKVIPSDKDRIKQLKEGKIHIADDINPDDAAAIKNETDYRLILRPCLNVSYIALNNEKLPFSKKNVRTAISYAIDKDDLIKKVYSDFAKPAKTFIPPLFIGYDDGIEKREYDIKKAKELLKEAGYSKGFKTTLWVMNSPRSYMPKPLETAVYIKNSLSKININVTIKTLNWSEYLNRIKNGKHEMALIGWSGDNMDPDNFLYTLLSSQNAKHGMASNYSFYKNNEVDMLLYQARQTNDTEFRKLLYKKVLSITNDDMPSIPLTHNMPVVVANPYVKGYVPSITMNQSLENVDIEFE